MTAGPSCVVAVPALEAAEDASEGVGLVEHIECWVGGGRAVGHTSPVGKQVELRIAELHASPLGKLSEIATRAVALAHFGDRVCEPCDAGGHTHIRLPKVAEGADLHTKFSCGVSQQNARTRGHAPPCPLQAKLHNSATVANTYSIDCISIEVIGTSCHAELGKRIPIV